MSTKIGTIIVSYHTGEVLFDCLQKVLDCQTITQIVLVNNGNPAETNAKLEHLATANSKLRLIDSKNNIGFGAACNLGARNSDCENLVFLNPDAIIENDAAQELVGLLDETPKIVGGLIIDENGQEQRGARRGELSIRTALIAFSGLGKLGKEKGIWRDFNYWREPLPNFPIEVGTISGAFFAIKKSDFNKLGGFDEGYFLHVEDIDLCYRIRTDLLGKVIFNPNARAMHIGGTSNAPNSIISWHKFKGFIRYFWKTKKGIAKIWVLLFAPILFCAIFGRDLFRSKKT